MSDEFTVRVCRVRDWKRIDVEPLPRCGSGSTHGRVRRFGYSLDGRTLDRSLKEKYVVFIDENGGGPGVRMRERQRPKSSRG